MRDNLNILFVDDHPLDVMIEEFELKREGLVFVSRTATNEPELMQALMEFRPDVVLCDYNMPGLSGLHAMQCSHRLRPATPVLMVSGAIAEYTAIECLNRGATDYLLKSNLRRLGPAVRRAVADVLHRQQLEDRIERLTYYDTVTGLPNLASIDQFFGHCVERARVQNCRLALAAFDLDKFRYVDEGIGRQLADQALKDISASLQSISPNPGCVARVGADQFLMVLSDIGTDLQIRPLIDRLLEVIAGPRRLAGRDLRVTASAGVALYPRDGANFETLLCHATAALHEAKDTRPGSFLFYRDDISSRNKKRRQLESDLRHAVESNELCLYYQPQFDIAGGQVCGVEALARWFRVEGKSIAPSVFIPLAERIHLIGALGTWALRNACTTMASWSGDATSAPLCVNVSVHQICAGFTPVIAAALESSGLSPGRLELEITESALLENSGAALKCLRDWKRLGVRLAVDDFGTGYSNLSYLSRLPLDRLKIDRSLIQGLSQDSRVAAVVRTVASLGRELGFTVLAEGVETTDQLRLVKDLGCDQAQGFLLMPPVAAAEARAVLEGRWAAFAQGRQLADVREARRDGLH